MKYYAVADDPNELLHYGRLGMKWGQHIFVGTKSLSYKKAEGKLRSKIQNAKASIQKSRTQHAINRQQRQQNRFAKAVQKTQQRIALTEGFRDLDRLKAYECSDTRAYKEEHKAERIAEKTARAQAKADLHYANNERKMQKYTQLARKGKLKYGKLSPDQVNQITNRLAIEANARRLGGAEETFRHRLKTATKEGILQGVTQGVAAGMKEVAINKVQNKLSNKRAMDKANVNEAKRQKEATRVKNHKSRSEVRQDARQEARESKFENDSRFARRIARRELTGQAYKLERQTHSARGREIQLLEARKDLNKRLAQAQMQDSKEGRKLLELESKNDILKKLKSAEAYDSDNGRKLLDTESKNDIYKKLKSAEAYDSNTGKELQKLEDKQHERKRLADAEDKRRNEIDELWKKYVDNGGDEKRTIGQSEPIDLSNNSKLSTKELYDKRAQVLAMDTEEKSKATYDAWASKEFAKQDKIAHYKAIEECEKRYDRKVKTWNNNGQKGPKPRYIDYVNAKTIAAAYEEPDVPTWEEAKRRKNNGLPGPLGNNNGQKQNNGGNKSNKGNKGNNNG